MLGISFQSDSKMAVGYLRCSTEEQNRSQLGLLAQRDAIESFCAREGMTLTETFTDVQSGKDDDRPQLQKALSTAKRSGGIVIVSKLCRLSRKVSYIAKLMDEGVPFVSVDLGSQVDPFVTHLWSAFAQAEVTKISQRTREALAQRKKEGIRLGNPRLGEVQPLAWAAKRKYADDFALHLKPLVEGCQQAGITSLTAIASHLNKIKQPTRTGKNWQPQSVKNVLRRIEAIGM